MKDKCAFNSSNHSDLDMEELLRELKEENNFLTKLVDTIPPKMYFEQEIQEKITAQKHDAMDEAAEDLTRRSSKHINLSAKGKHKRARLDPLQQKSVSQINEELDKENKMMKKKKRKQKALFAQSASITRAANVEELQKRLQERISGLRARRKGSGSGLKSKKEKKKEKKLNKQKGNLKKPKEFVKAEKSAEKPKNNPKQDKPVFNQEGNFLFSKFQFTDDGKGETKKNEYAGKKAKSLLKKAEKKQEKIENLKSSDPEKAKLIMEKEMWKKAIQKSENVKVKDDPILLKKSLKSEEKRKKKSAKAWKGRIDETEKRKKVRQDKRNKNIKERKQAKLEHKIKLAKKKGRVIPGF